MRGYSTSLLINPEITITTTGNIDDLDFQNSRIIRMNNATTATIRGLKAGQPGQRITIVSIGAGNVQLAHQDTNSVAGNRLINFMTTASYFTSLANGVGTATYQYDSITARWRLVTHDQGAFISYTANWTGSSANPAIGDGTLLTTYFLRNREIDIVVNLVIGSTTTLGTGTWLISLPIPFDTSIIPIGSVHVSTSGGTVSHVAINTIITAYHANGDIVGIDTAGNGIGSVTPVGITTGDIYRASLTYGVQ